LSKEENNLIPALLLAKGKEFEFPLLYKERDKRVRLFFS